MWGPALLNLRMERRSIRWRWLALLLVAGLAGAYAVHRDLYGTYLEYRESDARVDALMDGHKTLEETRDALQRRVDLLGSDPVEIEASIRRGKNLVREGERVYRIELDQDATANSYGEGSDPDSRDSIK